MVLHAVSVSGDAARGQSRYEDVLMLRAGKDIFCQSDAS